MKLQPRSLSAVVLLVGLVFLAIGVYADKTIFTWTSAALIIVSLILGGRWLKPRRK